MNEKAWFRCRFVKNRDWEKSKLHFRISKPFKFLGVNIMITNVSPKKWLLMSLGAMLLSGCATTSTDPSRQNVGTTGLLICAQNELCPVVTVSWNESNKELLKLKMHLSSTYNKYDIQKVVFTNGQKKPNFCCHWANRAWSCVSHKPFDQLYFSACKFDE